MEVAGNDLGITQRVTAPAILEFPNPHQTSLFGQSPMMKDLVLKKVQHFQYLRIATKKFFSLTVQKQDNLIMVVV